MAVICSQYRIAGISVFIFGAFQHRYRKHFAKKKYWFIKLVFRKGLNYFCHLDVARSSLLSPFLVSMDTFIVHCIMIADHYSSFKWTRMARPWTSHILSLFSLQMIIKLVLSGSGCRFPTFTDSSKTCQLVNMTAAEQYFRRTNIPRPPIKVQSSQ